MGHAAVLIDHAHQTLRVRRPPDDDEWKTIVATMAEKQITTLDAPDQMTDAAMAMVSELDHPTGIRLPGSKQVTDVGLHYLSRLPRLQELNLSGCRFDRSRAGRSWRSYRSCEGSSCSGTRTCRMPALRTWRPANGNGARGPSWDCRLETAWSKRLPASVTSGTDDRDPASPMPAFPLLHRTSPFSRPGTAVRPALTRSWRADAEPNHLMVDGPFTDVGLRGLRGLDGLVSLSLFWHSQAFTADGLAALAELPRLMFLGCEGHEVHGRGDALHRLDPAAAHAPGAGHRRHRRRLHGVEPIRARPRTSGDGSVRT